VLQGLIELMKAYRYISSLNIAQKWTKKIRNQLRNVKLQV
jgi:hypothetical protein